MIDVVWVGQGEPFQIGPRPDLALRQREAGQAIHRVRRDEGQRASGQGAAQEGCQRHAPHARRQADELHHGNLNTPTPSGQTPRPCSRSTGRLWVSICSRRSRIAPSCIPARTPTNSTPWSGAATAAWTSSSSRRWYFPLQHRIAVRRAVAILVRQGQSRRGAAGGRQEADGRSTTSSRRTGDTKKQDELMKQILQIAQDQFYAIGHRPAHQRLRHRQEQLQERAEDAARAPGSIPNPARRVPSSTTSISKVKWP